MIDLDYASGTPVDPAVLEVFCRAEREFPGNPAAAHARGRAAREALERSIAAIAGVLGVYPEEVILTSGASEANNMAVKGLTHACRHAGRHILTTCLEHPSVSGALTALQEQGFEVESVSLDTDGAVDQQDLESRLRRDTVLLTLPLVDSELGSVQPLEQVAHLLEERFPGCRLHVDATQAAGKVPLPLEQVDTLTLTPHKFYGLKGIGALVRRNGTALTPLIHGGVGTSLYRAGTPTVALAAAFAEALERAHREMDERNRRVAALREQLLAGLTACSGVRLNSTGRCVPHILNLSVAGIKGVDMQRALDSRGVCVSVKSACGVPGTPSRPVLAVTGDRKNAMWSWRISLSHLTTESEIHAFLDCFHSCYKELCP